MIKKSWNGPVTEFFGGKSTVWADVPPTTPTVKGWNDEPYGSHMTEAEYNKEIFGEPVATGFPGDPSIIHWSRKEASEVKGPQGNLTPNHLEQIDGMTVATKHDGGKTNWSLLPWDAVEEIIKVLQFGAGKYSPWNWAENGGFKFDRLFNSSMRHFVAWFWYREDADPETGLSHMAHLGCNVLFLLHYGLNGNKFKTNDNRPNVS